MWSISAEDAAGARLTVVGGSHGAGVPSSDSACPAVGMLQLVAQQWYSYSSNSLATGAHSGKDRKTTSNTVLSPGLGRLMPHSFKLHTPDYGSTEG